MRTKVYITKLEFAVGAEFFLVFDEENWNLLKSAASEKSKFLAVFGSEKMLLNFSRSKDWEIIETNTIKTDKTFQEALEEIKCKSA